MQRSLAWWTLFLWLAGCCVAAADGSADGSDESAIATARGPFVRILGTVQDGGMPHAACRHELCEQARRDPALRRLVASVAVIWPDSGRVVMIDATPDIREQLDMVADVRQLPKDRVDRAPIDGLLLTHAHIGHYLGLAFFGYEAVHTRGLPVDCTPRMAEFLERNAPWSELLRRGNIDVRKRLPGAAFEIGPGVTATAIRAPHRDELSDTVGWLLRGAERSVLYVPDTDTWSTWQPAITELLESVDVALVDATFFSLDELPGRSLEEVPHPLIGTTMDLLQPLVEAGRLEVMFIHLNHSNPALEANSAARREVERRGFRIAAEGDEIDL